MSALRVVALPGIPEIRRGDDLAELILAAVARVGEIVRTGDVLVVTSKIVSKAMGLLAAPGDRREVVARETIRVVAERMTASGPTRVVEGRTGVVSAAAGVDASNTGPGDAVLILPADPDAAARELHRSIGTRLGHERFGIVVTDTAGRPWRAGQIDFALGAHGIRVLEDYRGRPDADGRPLDVTAIAIADEVAAAADLVKGKTTSTPVALVRGLAAFVTAGHPRRPGGDPRDEGAARLIRTGPTDFFAMGHLEAVRAALGAAPGSAESVAVGIRPVGADALTERLGRALRLAALAQGRAATDDWIVEVAGAAAAQQERATVRIPGSDDYALGRLAARIEVAAWSEGLRADVARDAGGLCITIAPAITIGRLDPGDASAG